MVDVVTEAALTRSISQAAGSRNARGYFTNLVQQALVAHCVDQLHGGPQRCNQRPNDERGRRLAGTSQALERAGTIIRLQQRDWDLALWKWLQRSVLDLRMPIMTDGAQVLVCLVR